MPMMIKLLLSVKFTTVLLWLKMNGDMNTAHNLKMSIVITHTLKLVHNVMVLGTVMISILSLNKSSVLLIPMMINKSILVMPLKENI
jgi:hypothetical protein